MGKINSKDNNQQYIYSKPSIFKGKGVNNLTPPTPWGNQRQTYPTTDTAGTGFQMFINIG